MVLLGVGVNLRWIVGAFVVTIQGLSSHPEALTKGLPEITTKLTVCVCVCACPYASVAS